MKILYIAPIFYKDAAIKLGLEPQNIGGWIESSIKNIINFNKDVDVTYAVFNQSKDNDLKFDNEGAIKLISCKYNNCNFLENIKFDEYDILHFYGTEQKYIIDLLPFIPLNKSIFYMQGIISACVKQYYASYDAWNDVGPLFRRYMKMNVNMMNARAKAELEVLKHAKNVIGRTNWDKAYCLSINPKINYYHCNETMRKSFYNNEWDVNKIDRHSIYVSQANYPIKGAHQLVEIIKELKKTYPSVKCYISGENILLGESLATKLGVSYASFIKKLVAKNHLEENIIYVGSLSEMEVKNIMLKSHVHLITSSIENSPNCLQEAMLMGVPNVSSFVGGISDFIKHNENGYLYPFNDPVMAAYWISRIFEDDNIANKFKNASMNDIKEIVDIPLNAINLFNTYLKVKET